MRVRPKPTREPYFAACVVCSKYVKRKPMNWKKYEMKMLARKRNIEPVGRSSTIMSALGSRLDGAWMVVSQYGGTASACASLYVYRITIVRIKTSKLPVVVGDDREINMLTGGA